jgi:hypothetical protein
MCLQVSAPPVGAVGVGPIDIQPRKAMLPEPAAAVTAT